MSVEAMAVLAAKQLDDLLRKKGYYWLSQEFKRPRRMRK